MDKCCLCSMYFANRTQQDGAGGRVLTNISYTLLTLLFFSYVMYLFNQNYVDFATSAFFIII